MTLVSLFTFNILNASATKGDMTVYLFFHTETKDPLQPSAFCCPGHCPLKLRSSNIIISVSRADLQLGDW